MPEISFVAPAYNQEDHIYDNINEFTSTFSELGYDFELILVNDGSADRTCEEAKKVKSDRLKVLNYSKNEGKGFALKYGASNASGKMIAFIDSDSDVPPRQIKTFIEYMDKNKADVVVGSKRHPLSKVSYPLQRRFLSFCYQIFVKLLFGLSIRDTQAGMKLFKREVLDNSLPRVLLKKYAFDLELLVVANHLGYKIVEAPIEINYRFNGSMVSLRAIWNIFIDTCAVFYRLKILKYYDRAIKNASLDTQLPRQQSVKEQI